MSNLSRRTVLTGAAASIITPVNAHAFVPFVARLALGRFFMGTVKSTARVVLVRLASDAIMNAIYNRSGNYSSPGYYSSTGIQHEANFDINRYKASTITLGVANYEVYQEKQIRLFIDGLSDEEIKRFEIVQAYLAAERLPLATHGMKYSIEVNNDTSLDTIISTKWFGNSWEREKHLNNIIKETGVNVFDDL